MTSPLQRRSPAAATVSFTSQSTSKGSSGFPELQTVKRCIRISMAPSDEDYFLPLEDQRVFGAGIKRKRVPFIPSSETDLQTTKSAPATTSTSPAPGPSIADKYLSIVLSSRSSEPPNPTTDTDNRPPDGTTSETQLPTCDICHLPLSSSSGDNTRPHASSIAHQVCLEHSQPPSAIDRRRAGYKYLSSYGWDPDARKGLGPMGHGIQVPLKTKIKNDTVGLGINVPEGAAAADSVKKKKKPQVKLDAKQIRKMEQDKRKQGERLGELFYRAEDVQKYLGE